MADSCFLQEQRDLDDLTLALRVREGDNEAFREISEKYKGLILSVANKYSASGFDKNDFFQEGLLGLLSACKAYDPEKNSLFRNFALTCINRRFLSVIRKNSAKGAIPTDSLVPIEELELSDENTSNPETLVLEKERAEDFEKKLHSILSPLELSVLELYLQGLSYQDTAQRLGVSVKSVDNALQRIRKKISGE